MTVDEFVTRIEALISGIRIDAPQGAWAHAAERLVQDLKTGPLTGTNLANELTWGLDGTLISILAPAYLAYQNWGVAGAVEDRSGAITDPFAGRGYSFGLEGKKPPADAFPEPYAWGIRTNVWKYGIKPKNWYTRESLETGFLAHAQSFITQNSL